MAKSKRTAIMPSLATPTALARVFHAADFNDGALPISIITTECGYVPAAIFVLVGRYLLFVVCCLCLFFCCLSLLLTPRDQGLGISVIIDTPHDPEKGPSSALCMQQRQRQTTITGAVLWKIIPCGVTLDCAWLVI